MGRPTTGGTFSHGPGGVVYSRTACRTQQRKAYKAYTNQALRLSSCNIREHMRYNASTQSRGDSKGVQTWNTSRQSVRQSQKSAHWPTQSSTSIRVGLTVGIKTR